MIAILLTILLDIKLLPVGGCATSATSLGSSAFPCWDTQQTSTNWVLYQIHRQTLAQCGQISQEVCGSNSIYDCL